MIILESKYKFRIALILIYITAYSGFILEVTGLTSLNSYLSLSIDFVIAVIGLRSLFNSSLNIATSLTIVVIALLNYLLNAYNFVSLINGLRELLVIVLIFAVYEEFCRTKNRNIYRQAMNQFIKTFLIIQIPITFYQFITYGAGDHVGGSLGTGNSGVLTLVTVLMVYVLIRTDRKKYGMNAYCNALFLLPLFLNETKISFLLIPIMFICLAHSKRNGSFVVSLCFGAVVFIALNSLYTDQGNSKENPFKEMFNQEYLEQYLMDDGIVGEDVPRFTKIATSMNLIGGDVRTLLFGLEVGAFKGGTIIKRSRFSKTYDWLLTGSRPYLFYLLISGGVSLSFLFLFYMWSKIFTERNMIYDINLSTLTAVVFIVILFYNDAFRSQFFVFFYSYMVLLGKGRFSSIRRKMQRQIKIIH